jgi:hypothetical protein
MLFLEVSTLELGDDVRAVGLDLRAQDEEPARGPETSGIWARVLPALAGGAEWALDFFSHLNRVREYCDRRAIAVWEQPGHALVIPAPSQEQIEPLCTRFEGETFGVRAGQALAARDEALERELVRRGVDAYHPAYGKYLFCAVCDFSEGSLVVLSDELGAGEVLRRVQGALKGLEVEVFQAS